MVDEPGQDLECLIRHGDDPLGLEDAHDEHEVRERQEHEDPVHHPAASREAEEFEGEGTEQGRDHPSEDVADEDEDHLG